MRLKLIDLSHWKWRVRLDKDMTIFQEAAPTVLYESPTKKTIIIEKNERVDVRDIHLLTDVVPHATIEIEVRQGGHLRMLTEWPAYEIPVTFSYDITLLSDATFEWFFCVNGGQKTGITVDVRLAGNSANATVHGMYVAKDKQQVELVINQRHEQPDSTSNVTVKGIVKEQARTLYRGVIAVAESAVHTVASLSNKNILVGPQARSRSEPTLEILTNAVKCKHGSAVGPLNSESLFYLESRGIDFVHAKRLLLDAFFSEILETVPDVGVRSLWQELIHE
jgi:Fe-S cluster assembly scaffold protein SufB